MRISIPEEGNAIQRLHEIKIICSSRTRYAPHRQGQEATRAVDNRVRELNSEYIKMARATDENNTWHYRTSCDITRQTWRCLKGVVVGGFGEGSEDLHTLIHHMDTSRVKEAGHQKGRR